ncbi:MAG: hypothetical protein ABJC13_25690 [Acidobacteriota bacterium]
MGTVGTLRTEILDTRVGLPGADGQIVKGTFQEVLQVRSFVGRSGVFHSEVLAAGGTPSEATWSDPPDIAVFDGAVSLLKFGDRWPGTARIIVLDRTDTRSTDAAAEINREYVQRIGEQALDHPDLRLRGCELLFYRARLG